VIAVIQSASVGVAPTAGVAIGRRARCRRRLRSAVRRFGGESNHSARASGVEQFIACGQVADAGVSVGGTVTKLTFIAWDGPSVFSAVFADDRLLRDRRCTAASRGQWTRRALSTIGACRSPHDLGRGGTRPATLADVVL
jgi:hypothetical protein